MSPTARVLRELNAVDGVAGSFVCNEKGRVLAREPVHLFDGDSLSETTRVLVETMIPLRAMRGADEIDLVFGDGRLIVRTVGRALLAVLCVPRINRALLRLRINMALKVLRRQIAAEEDEDLSRRLDRTLP